MKLCFYLVLALGVSSSLFAKEVYITLGSDSISSIRSSVSKSAELLDSVEGISIVKVNESELLHVSHMMHEDFNRCGGYVFHDSLEEARAHLFSTKNRLIAKKGIFDLYEINQDNLVESLIKKVKEEKILGTIQKLSSYKNRYYQAQTGVDSQKWLASEWAALTSHRSDSSVELFNHSSWSQPSVILTIKGKSDDIVVIGGHGDSIAGFWGRANAKAPGADDNASGISTITEVIRVLVEANFVPEKTLKFMSYAAEEVGLRGSKEIAKKMKREGKSVIGAMQLDMTNFSGSNLDIVMMTDYTNSEQNAFIGKLLDHYLPTIKWGYDRCGYACSDHASWHNEGYPASMPFEAKKDDMNRHIHTGRDTVSQSGGNANHASKFAKMAVAFAVELSK